MSGKLLENRWKKTGNGTKWGTSTLTTSGVYFYPGDPETLSERKSADFCRKMTSCRDSP